MNVFGIGGLELVMVLLVALLVVGPTRLVQGARTARKYMTELRRQRDELTQMVEEAVDLEGIRSQLDEDGVFDEVRDLSSELESFKTEARSATIDVSELARSVTRPSGYSRLSETSTQSQAKDNDASGEDGAEHVSNPDSAVPR